MLRGLPVRGAMPSRVSRGRGVRKRGVALVRRAGLAAVEGRNVCARAPMGSLGDGEPRKPVVSVGGKGVCEGKVVWRGTSASWGRAGGPWRGFEGIPPPKRLPSQA